MGAARGAGAIAPAGEDEPAWCTSSRRSIRLIIQRKRTELFFDYGHRFEAYLPKEKRLFGYFALPVLVGDDIVAAIDLKTDRQNKKLLMQKWSWVGKGAAAAPRARIQAPHRGSAASFRAVSVGGVGGLREPGAELVHCVDRIATNRCNRLKLLRGLPAIARAPLGARCRG